MPCHSVSSRKIIHLRALLLHQSVLLPTKLYQASCQCRRLISSRIAWISLVAISGFLEILKAVACFPSHWTITIGSTDCIIFLNSTLVFEAQWLQCFPLLWFLLQNSARKTNPSWGLLVLSSSTPWNGRQILQDVEIIEFAKLLTPRSGSLAHCWL